MFKKLIKEEVNCLYNELANQNKEILNHLFNSLKKAFTFIKTHKDFRYLGYFSRLDSSGDVVDRIFFRRIRSEFKRKYDVKISIEHFSIQENTNKKLFFLDIVLNRSLHKYCSASMKVHVVLDKENDLYLNKPLDFSYKKSHRSDSIQMSISSNKSMLSLTYNTILNHYFSIDHKLLKENKIKESFFVQCEDKDLSDKLHIAYLDFPKSTINFLFKGQDFEESVKDMMLLKNDGLIDHSNPIIKEIKDFSGHYPFSLSSYKANRFKIALCNFI